MLLKNALSFFWQSVLQTSEIVDSIIEWILIQKLDRAAMRGKIAKTAFLAGLFEKKWSSRSCGTAAAATMLWLSCLPKI